MLVREVERHTEEPWVIINVPGAGGTIGSRRVKDSRPDGHTLLFLHDGILTAKFANQALYGPEAFRPIAATGRLGMVICVAEDSRYQSLEDLMREAADATGTVTFSANIGAPSYFMARLMEQSHGTAAFRYVQSGGGARRFSDLSGGHVTASAFSISEYLNFREGGIRALAVLDVVRHPQLAGVPTAQESGYDITYSNLQGWWSPPGTPDAVLQERQRILQKAFESPEIQSYCSQQCIDPLFLSGTQLDAAMQEKTTMLSALELGFERKHLPPTEQALGIAFLLGLVLTLGSFSGNPPLSRQVPAESSGNRLAQGGILGLFLLSLSLPLPVFWAGGAIYVVGSSFLALGTQQAGKTILVAVLAPGILFLFLSTLLGISLP